MVGRGACVHAIVMFCVYMYLCVCVHVQDQEQTQEVLYQVCTGTFIEINPLLWEIMMKG